MKSIYGDSIVRSLASIDDLLLFIAAMIELTIKSPGLSLANTHTVPATDGDGDCHSCASSKHNWTALQFQFSHRYDGFGRRQQCMRPRIPRPPMNKIHFTTESEYENLKIEFVQRSAQRRPKRKNRFKNDEKKTIQKRNWIDPFILIAVCGLRSKHHMLPTSNAMHGTIATAPGEVASDTTKKNLLRICMIAMRELCSESKSYSVYIVCRRSALLPVFAITQIAFANRSTLKIRIRTNNLVIHHIQTAEKN